LLSGDAAGTRVVQSVLFVPKCPDPEKLELTVARLAKLVGEGNVGAAELVDTHRAENFRMSKFVSVPEQAKRPRKNGDAAIGGAASSTGSDGEFGFALRGAVTPAGFRIIRPAVPVRVELLEHHPVHLQLGDRARAARGAPRPRCTRARPAMIRCLNVVSIAFFTMASSAAGL
jgi:hypothetical protein